LSLEEKEKTYLLLIKYLLMKNEIGIKRIKDKILIGNYKTININIKCLFKQECYMIKKNDVKKFENKLNEDGIGFLVSNVYISEEAIERVGNNDRIYLCHENQLVNDIKIVEKFKCNNLKVITKGLNLNNSDLELKYLIEEIVFLDDFQKIIKERQDVSNISRSSSLQVEVDNPPTYEEAIAERQIESQNTVSQSEIDQGKI
ncbi:7962_t:CDS:2, partial [Scutellospora calospora]